MMDFKKRALILTLAATVSVTGSFAADNYKNCLMNMEFQPVNDNEIRLILNTKNNYAGSVTPLRKNASTFIIMLPETDNQAVTPDLTNVRGAIESVEISKMPYANGSKGYTKILVKTAGVINLDASTALYVPTAEDLKAIEERRQQEERRAQEERRKQEEIAARKAAEKAEAAKKQARLQEMQLNQNSQPERSYQPETRPAAVPVEPEQVQEEYNEEPVPEIPVVPVSDDSSNQKYLLILAIVLIVIVSTYIYIKGQENMHNVMGENLKIDIDDEENNDKKSKKKRKHQISRTVNRLDNMYKDAVLPFNNNEYTQSPVVSEPNTEPEEEINIVDLDALFKEKQSQETEETSALDDFLSGFSFDEEVTKDNETKSEISPGFDEEIYENLINNSDIKFTDEDIVCFNELLQSEVSDDVIKNIDKYTVSNPIKHKNRPIDKILEKLVSNYMISQNITFTHEDIEILKKLLTVEIDPDFVTDLRTNPELTKEMEKSIIAGSSKRKPSEILTLNVKDMLPNLSDALKKQGRKPILSEAQPEVVYYSEGYDVDKLVLDFDLPDLSKEIKNKKAYMEKPSYSGDTVDQSYADSVEKLQTSGLPDLKDVIAHPKKYAEPKKKEFVPDEKTLLNNLMNVQFKPFDDGTRNFEIINDVEEDEKEEINLISTEDIQNEFRQFENFELASNDNTEKNYIQSDYDDFENLYKQDFVDLDKEIQGNVSAQDSASTDVQNEYADDRENPDKNLDIPKIKMDDVKSDKKKMSNRLRTSSEKFVLKDLDRKRNIPKRLKDQENSEKLISILEKFRFERKSKKVNNNNDTVNKAITNKIGGIQPQPLVKCILDGINYDVVASAAIDEQLGCHLVKSEKGYVVLAYKNSELSVLKEYSELKAEKLFVRLSETLDDGTPRYLVKVGASKFIVDIIDGQVRYVMDLC